MANLRFRQFFQRSFLFLASLGWVLGFTGCATHPENGVRKTSTTFTCVVLDAGHGGHDSGARSRKGLLEKGCYEIVDLPAGEKIIKFKWVYAVKGSSKGHVVRFKARLTARGDLVDVEDLDFDDVFSPVVSWEGVRTYLALTVLLGLIPLQLDVDLAYLYADLEQPVYIVAPE
jgi:hypothetical protein